MQDISKKYTMFDNSATQLFEGKNKKNQEKFCQI